MMLNAQTPTRPAITAAFEVIPTGAILGAEVRADDLRTLDHAGFAHVLRAWHAHSVVLFRNQALSDHDLIAFSRRLGDLDWAPVQENGRRFVEGLPEIYIVSNVKVNGEAIGSLGDGEAVWHTDMSYLEVPPKASMLYALEIPLRGGNTSFCSMYSIYDALPAALKARIEGLKIKHDGTYNSGGYVRQGVTPTDDPRTSPGRCIRWCAPILTPDGACSISAAAATPTSPGLTSRHQKPCWMSCGATWRGLNLRGSTSGGSAIWCCGTIAAPCTGATRSTPTPGASCIAPR